MNGEYCPAPGIERNRELNIKFICPLSTSADWDIVSTKVITEEVTETPTCVYNMEFESPLACPPACITTSSLKKYSVCSSHGICAADPVQGNVFVMTLLDR